MKAARLYLLEGVIIWSTSYIDPPEATTSHHHAHESGRSRLKEFSKTFYGLLSVISVLECILVYIHDSIVSLRYCSMYVLDTKAILCHVPVYADLAVAELILVGGGDGVAIWNDPY